ncbi:MmgE/PrpD family protein [Rhizosaccharibacter radicis]|uniref:MmgE/PrpD family protein n=1 Tax=Rhizosaccharibacter radicis TaxID=2782605 RepID=A0ABT1VTA0_9PROT|nr:MmgE/PrpD family protein [Acetobacteraceae bacterium KSS12]
MNDTAVTRIIADFVRAYPAGGLPEAVRHEAHRTFLNWLGCAVGGSRDETVDIALAALLPFSGAPEAHVLGRRERCDALHAALLNGIASHVFDFDDTHLRTVIHPAGPVASALLAFAEHCPTTGSAFIDALALGIEVECRIGNAVFPEHYDIGWHITATAGVFGAAAAVGRLLDLDTERMSWALGLAATQPVGLREMFGTMTKSFHPGRAAQNGMTAALLAARGYTSSIAAIEAKRGWANILSTGRRYAEITDNLGGDWQILSNTYKPFACGIVIHPAIDGCLQLRQRDLDPGAIERVSLKVHPLVLELTGKRDPQTGLEGKFSVFHCAAAALIEGDAGVKQFTERCVRDPAIVSLRNRVEAEIDPSLDSDAARVEIRMRDRAEHRVAIEHAIGSLARPMTDAQLEAKFRGLSSDILGVERCESLIRQAWHLGDTDDAARIARDAVPA